MIKPNIDLCPLPDKQRGVATLLTAVVLLIVILAISFYTSETVITEKKVVANEYRAKQAFHAAQAGLDYAIAYAREGVDQNSDSILDLSGASGATATIGTSSYFVTLADLSAGSDMSLLKVESIGRSDDGLITRTVSVLIGELPVIPNPPDLPMVARGNVNTIGNLQVYNQYENLNMWVGEEVDSWGSSDTYVRDPDWPGFAGDTWDGTVDDLQRHLAATDNTVVDIPAIKSTTKNTRGPDIIDGDSNLETLTGAEFITNFFGTDIPGLVDSATETFTSSGDLLAGSPSGIVNLDDGDDLFQISGSGTIGSATNPVILVVDGSIKLSGNVTIYGLVVAKTFVTGNGTVDVIGGLIAEDDFEKMNGTFSVYFDPGVLGELEELKILEVVRGSWMDW